MLGVSVSGYDSWRRRPLSARAVRHAMLLEVIAEIHRASRRTYGARRIHAELVHGRGVTVARCTVELVMRRNGISGLLGRPRWRKIPNQRTASDLVDRRFYRDGPDELWVTDLERHEVFLNPAVVRGHRVGVVAAGWLKLRAAGPGGHRGGWKQP